MAKNALALSAFVIVALVQGSPRAEDLLDIYRLAIAEDPQFRQVGSAKSAAEESHKQARSRLLLPTLNFEGNISKNYEDITIPQDTEGLGGSTDFTSRLYQLNFTQPLFHYDRYVELK